MNYVTFYNTLTTILDRLLDEDFSQSGALDALERLNESGKSLGLMVSPNVVLLTDKSDVVDVILRDTIINSRPGVAGESYRLVLNDDDFSSDDYDECLDCGTEVDSDHDYCDSCQAERTAQREADSREEDAQAVRERTVTTIRS